MLGRHVYRVAALSDGSWTVEREGNADRVAPKGSEKGPPRQATAVRSVYEDKAAAVAAAVARATADLPSKVVIEKSNGALDTERLFGTDEGLREDPARLA